VPVSRPVRAWRRFNRLTKHSALGRAFRAASAKWLDWWYPQSGVLLRKPENRLILSLRLWNWWIRHTWPGRKLEWVLDDAAELWVALQNQYGSRFNAPFIRKSLFRWQTGIWAAVLLGLPVAGYTLGLPRLRLSQEDHYAQQAEQFLDKGDLTRAMIRCRQVLAMDFSNAIATRVFAGLADSYGSPAALYWRERALLLRPDVANQIALASTAVRMEAFPFPTAAKTLGGVDPTFQRTANYQRVAGALALKLSKIQEAEQHFLEAYNLDPTNPVNRMSLAVIQLQSKDPKLISDSRTTLQLLMNDREVGLVATRSLVAESIDRGDFNRAQDLSLLLLKNTQSTFSDRILHLVILNASHSTNFSGFLKETEQHAQDNPEQVGALTAWMNTSGFARQALDWLNHLPPEFTREGLLPIAMADAYCASGEWKELEKFLQERSWPGLEHIRFAMLALADAKQSGGFEDSVAWQRAVEFAADSPDALNTLAKLAASWGWADRTLDLLWFAARQYPKQIWPLTSLGDIYAAQRNTTGLWRVAKTAFERNPSDKLDCNNYVMLSLLLDAETAQARKYAGELYAGDPKNPVFASTYAFSLYQQGRAEDGLKVFNELGPGPLKEPAMAVYYGILLAAAGEKTAAKPYLDQADKAFLMPEEQALVARAKIGLVE
jgi:tetratricopeptide (TPR) repeat protein